MKLFLKRTAVALVVALAPALGPVPAQESGDDVPPPPEVQRLIDLAKDPERIRQVMSDPDKIQEIMTSLDNDAVRQFMSDPRRVQQLMREIDPQQIQEAMRQVDFSKVRQAMASRWKMRLKQMLGATDDEWKALEPKIENVVRAQQETRVGIRGGGGGGAFGGGGGRGLPLTPRADRPAEPSKVEEAVADLREAMDDPDLPGAEVSRRLKAYRSARDKARQKLEDAERELKELLTQRQEGILLMAGILN